MANCDNLMREFNENLQVPKGKQEKMTTSKESGRIKIRAYFKKNHPDYIPSFFIQGSRKTKNMIRTKDDTCDLDDGVYFNSNPDDVSGTTLQSWVYDAVDGTTDATPAHCKKCIRVDYKAGYNIDYPVFVFDESKDSHPQLAVKNADFKEDDPKEFIEFFEKAKDKDGQMIRLSRYLKGFCDYKREKMPSGLVMTILTLKYWQKNDRDDVALKYTLIEIENALKGPNNFHCYMPTTPNEDLFADYEDDRRDNFLNNLAKFIEDAKKAVDEENNQLKASRCWQKHLGKTYFPDGEDKDDVTTSASRLSSVIGESRPYFGSK